MADKKVSELTSLNNLSGDDLLLVVNDPDGTPSSRKTPVSRLFGNVAVQTRFNDTVRHNSNVIITGTTTTVSANLVVDGLNVANEIRDRIQVSNATLLINDRIQVANADLKYLQIDNPQANGTVSALGFSGNTIRLEDPYGFNLTMANSETLTSNNVEEGITFGTIYYSNNYLYIATTPEIIKRVALREDFTSEYEVSNADFQSYVANTNNLVNDRIQVSNAITQFANSTDSVLTGNTTATNITSNTLTIQSNTGLVVSGGGITDQVPASSNATNENIAAGTIWYSNNHLYIAVDNNTIKRVNLSTF